MGRLAGLLPKLAQPTLLLPPQYTHPMGLTAQASHSPSPPLLRPLSPSVPLSSGTDVLEGDPLGRLGVTAQGVLKRDAMVWDYALHTAQAPILMTLSGGYTRASAQASSWWC